MGYPSISSVTFHECKGHYQKARSVAWNSLGNLLASGSTDKTAKIWSIEGSGQGREVNSLSGHEDSVERVRWHPQDPHILCTASADRTILLWDVRAPTPSFSINQKIAQIDLISKEKKHTCPASVEWHPDGNSLAVAEKDNLLHIYDLRKQLAHHENSVSSSKLSRNNNNNNRHHYPATLDKPIITHRLKPDLLSECVFSPTGQHLVAATKDTSGMGAVRFWKADDVKKPHTSIVGHIGPIFCLRFSPCKTRLATGGQDALVGLWDTSDMICTSTISRLSKFIRSVSFSHDSRLLASSSEERYIDIADADTGEKVGHIEARHGADELAWNPKYYALAYASGDTVEMNSREKERVPCVAVAKITIKDN